MAFKKAWPWFLLGLVLALMGLFILGGSVGAVVLAVGLLAIFGAGVRVISSRDPTPPDERRVPAGHSGM